MGKGVDSYILHLPKIISNLVAENLALCHQLTVMKLTNKLSKIQVRDRFFWVILSLIWIPRRKSLVIVRPDTVVRWYRKVLAKSVY